MEHDALTNPGPASQPDPAQVQSGRTIPERIAALLHAVHILLGYGRHLVDTVNQRAAAPSFTTVAACFGTAKLSVILARLRCGILRAVALERVLLARAASGRDVEYVQLRVRTGKPPAAPDDTTPDQSAEAPVAASHRRKLASRPARQPGRDDAEFYIPTLEELEAQVRRRPLGRTIVDICLDLAVVPGFCTGTFWNELFEIMQYYGGSVVTLMQERRRREKVFAEEQDRRPTGHWDWANLTREAILKVLGFFIGEEPTNPFAGVAAATGPPLSTT
jgi:hypothetical protein